MATVILQIFCITLLVVLNLSTINSGSTTSMHLSVDIKVMSDDEDGGEVKTFTNLYSNVKAGANLGGSMQMKDGGVKKAFQNQALDFINDLRAKHGVAALVLDQQMTARAQQFAESISVSGKLGISCKSGNCGYGENQAMGPPNEDIGEEVKMSIQRWYDTSADYDYATGKGTGGRNPYSFTALVWKGSKKAGIGAAQNEETGYIYIVVQFAPAGNIMGFFTHNVFRPGSALTGDVPPPNLAPTFDESSDKQQETANDDSVVKPKPEKIKEIQEFVFIKINIIRKNHKSPPLAIDVQLMASAQDYAEELASNDKLAKSCKAKRCDYGENLAMISEYPDLTAAINVTMQRWHDGNKDFDFAAGKGKPNSATGTFTALVWKGSKKLGIGTATNKVSGRIYIVFRFSPPGNVKGKYPQNVLPSVKPEDDAKPKILASQPPKASTNPKDANTDAIENEPKAKPAPKSKNTPESKAPTPDSKSPNKPGTAPVFGTDSIKGLPNSKSSSPEEFQKVALGFINKLRKKHKAPPLTLAKDLNTKAQAHAEDLAMTGSLGQSCKKDDCPYSENNGLTSPQANFSTALSMTIQSWYDENSNYNFVTGEPQFSMVIKDFTTLVWKSAKTIGVGVAVGKENGYNYISIQFAPTTNIPGQYLSNVFPASPGGEDANTVNDDAPDNGDEWRAKVLAMINELRAKHKSPPLALDLAMTTRAQKYAETLSMSGKLDSSCKSGGCGYGENLAMGPGGNKDIAEASMVLIKVWYEQRIEYDYVLGASKSGKPVGSFTALVWKGSTKVGIGGSVKKSNGYIYLVIQFSAVGNMKGAYQKNVLSPPEGAEGSDLAETAGPDKGNGKCAAKGPCPKTKGKAAKAYLQDGLDAINEIRLKHHASPVCLDDNLNKLAQKWAESIAARNKLDLSCKGNDCCYGEIQAQRPPNDDLSEEVKGSIQKWYEEIKDYDFKKGSAIGSKMITGFTAIAWKGSTKIGIGAYASEESQATFVVIQFSPPGNTRHQYTTNVLPE